MILKPLGFQRTKMEMADGRANLKGKRRYVVGVLILSFLWKVAIEIIESGIWVWNSGKKPDTTSGVIRT